MGKKPTPSDQLEGFFCLRTGWRGIDSLEEREKSELKDYTQIIGALRKIAKVEIQRLPFYKVAGLLRLKIKNILLEKQEATGEILRRVGLTEAI